METIVGLMFWGGLLVLASRGVMRLYRRPSSRAPVTPTRSAAPSTRPSTAQPVVEESARESGALVDGLIIGHHLTRTHYEDRLAEQAEAIEALRADMGGYGAVGLGDAEADEFESDEFESDESEARDGPWDDDVFGYDEDDDD